MRSPIFGGRASFFTLLTATTPADVTVKAAAGGEG